MITRQKHKLVAILAITIALGAACAKNPNIQTPEGKRAATALEATQRIGEFQNFVISLSDAKKIPVDTARVIVRWCVESLKTLETAPIGWRATLDKAWASIRAEASKLPDLATWIPVIDSLLTP